jgi:hypothetical protein
MKTLPATYSDTPAREWKKRGASIESLSKILRHTSTRITRDECGTEDLEAVQENHRRPMTDLY